MAPAAEADHTTSKAPSPKVGEQRPGGRAERVRTAVLQATAELLIEVGYEGLSVDEVATRAGVHKTTVYRRWPGKAELVAAAAQRRSEKNIPVPDTGAFQSDLEEFVRSIIANVDGEAAASGVRSLLAAAAGSEELSATMSAFWRARITNATPIIDRAIARGELPPDTDARLVIETAIGPIWVRLLLTGEPFGQELAVPLAGLVVSGASRS